MCPWIAVELYMVDGEHDCVTCSRSFSAKSSLRKHVRRKNPLYITNIYDNIQYFQFKRRYCVHGGC